MRTVCIVQSRMGNTRLPGKNGMLICGKPQIWHVLNRIKKVRGLDDIMLAIPYECNGGIQIEAARSLGIETLNYRGNPSDLVRRYLIAAEIMDASIVVRIPGDNTFVEPEEVERILEHYRSTPCSWDVLTTNLDRDVLGNGYPGGLGAEVYDVRYFHWVDKHVDDKEMREHPHKWAFVNHRVRTIQAPGHLILPYADFSVNTPADFGWTKSIYDQLYPTNHNFTVRDVLRVHRGE